MEFKSNETIYSQIVEYVKKKIFSGRFGLGEKLPAIRDFAVFCKVNPNTIVRVYQQLETEGLIYTDSTNGKFVILSEEALRRKKEEYLAEKVKGFVSEIKESGVDFDKFLLLAEEAFHEDISF